MHSIYEYDDHRRFLLDAFREKKRQDSSYSHRKFARAAGIANPGYLNDVIKGRRPLSRAAAGKMGKALGLNEGEIDYLLLLVDYEKASSEERRTDIRRRIQYRRRRSSFARTNPAMVRYYEDYRYSLIRAAIEVFEFRGEYEQLGRFLSPPVPAEDVRRIVRDLCWWNLVEQGADGRYRVTSRMIEPSPRLSRQIRAMNREWIRQALGVQEHYAPERRHISSMLCTLSEATEKRILRRIEALREEIFDMLDRETEPEKLAILNIQFFPRSRSRSGR